jgi:EAL and modified HD-GYP domain-containing signal transduction protein
VPIGVAMVFSAGGPGAEPEKFNVLESPSARSSMSLAYAGQARGIRKQAIDAEKGVPVFKTILRWLGLVPPAAAPLPQEAAAQLDALAPLQSAPRAGATTNTRRAASFVCREELLDRGEQIAGYEFALGRNLQSPMLEKSAKLRQVHDEALLHNLSPLAVSSLLGDRFAFIRLSSASLSSLLLPAFANRNVIIMITPATAVASDLADVRVALRRLQDLGVRHGWSLDRPLPGMAEFLEQAALVEIDTTAFDGIQLKKLCVDLHASKGKPRVIASKIQSADDFSLCYQSGFDYFMGPFVCSRENWHPPKSEVNRLLVFEVLNMLRSRADFGVIADRLRNDPILTYKLLRYINSPGIGMLKRIEKIPQALLILGRDQFSRWLSLLLFDLNQPGYVGRVLNENALTRARFMERLAGQGGLPQEADKLFMIGLFSLLDVMMKQPLAEILKKVSLPDDVVSALQGAPGAMCDALALAIAVESKAPDEIAAAALLCGLEAQQVTAVMLEALDWAQNVVHAGKN